MSNFRSIVIKCKGAGTLALDAITPLQGRFKILTDDNRKRLCREIMVDGYLEPISVWEDATSAKIYILNGHQRREALLWLRDHGWTDDDGVHWNVKIPQLPVNYVDAKDLAEAKRNVLALASQYGSVSTQGLRSLVEELGITHEDLASQFNFPEIDIAALMSGLEVPAMIGMDFETNPRLTDRDITTIGPTTVKNTTPQEMPALNTGDREPYQQKAFHLHDEQVAIVDEAMALAIELFGAEATDSDLTENKNSNTLAFICQKFIDENSGDES